MSERLTPALWLAVVAALLWWRADDLAAAWRVNRGYVQVLPAWQPALRAGVDRYRWRAHHAVVGAPVDGLPPAGQLPPALAHSAGRLLWLNGQNQPATVYLAGACAAAAALACSDYLSAVAATGDAGRVVTDYAATLPALPLAAVGDSVEWAYLQTQRVVPADLSAATPPNLAWLQAGRALPGAEADDQQALQRFALASVWPADAQLLPLMAAAADDLVAAGIWDGAQRQRLAAFWRWQYPQSALLATWPPATALAPLPAPPPTARTADNLLALLDPTAVGWPHSDWRTAAFLGDAGGAALTGADANETIRIDVLWYGGSGFFGVVGRPRNSAGGSYFLPIVSGQRYVLSGQLRTAGGGEAASVYVGNPQAQLFDLALPATDGAWQPFSAAACGPQSDQPMQIVLRLRSAGSVWFSELLLRPDDAPCEPAGSASHGG